MKIYSIVTFDPGNDGGVGHAILRVYPEEGRAEIDPINVWIMPYVVETVERKTNIQWNKAHPDKKKKPESYKRRSTDHRGLTLAMKEIVKHTRRLEENMHNNGQLNRALTIPIIAFVEKVNPYSYFFGGQKAAQKIGPKRSDPWSMQGAPGDGGEGQAPQQGNIFQSPHQVWAFAGSVHSIKQVLADYNIKGVEVTPQAWQKHCFPHSPLPKRSPKTEAQRNQAMATRLTALFPLFPFPKRTPRAKTLHTGGVVAGLLFDYAKTHVLNQVLTATYNQEQARSI